MNETEDLLTRTLRDPDRALPAPADPVAAIRTRARAQRRTATLTTAAVLAVIAAAALVVPATLRERPPVATGAPPAGLLPWPARGALAGDQALVEDAARVWDGAKRPVHLLWAERLGGDGGQVVVLLQGFDAEGRPRLAEVADRGQGLELVRSDPLLDPGVAAVRLVEPLDPSRAATFLLVAPGTATVLAAERDSAPLPTERSGLFAVPAELGGSPVALLGRDGAIVGSGEVPPRGTLTVPRGRVRLAAPQRRTPNGAGWTPEASYWAEGRLLADRLDERLGNEAPTEVAMVDDSFNWNTAGGEGEARFYELRRSGRTYLASAIWLAGRPYCLRLDDVAATRPSPDVLVIRCLLPDREQGLVHVIPVDGVKVTEVRVDAAGAGQTPVRTTLASPMDGYTAAYGLNFPTGPGLVRLVDDAGRPRPPALLPAYGS